MENSFCTAAQKTFFETFGYLHLPGLMKADIGWIIEDYEAVWSSRPDIVHGAKGRQTSFPATFVLETPRLSTLIEDPRIEPLLNLLLGDTWTLNGGDGSLYDGDTQWHSDIALWEDESLVRNVKVAFYLDPLTRETGALRVIPGSHLFGDRYCAQLSTNFNDMKHNLGIDGSQVPAVALECQPGDVVMFDHRLKHASFGGGKRRRLMNLNVMESIHNEAQKEAMRNLFRFYRDTHDVKWEFDKKKVDAMPPERMRHFAMTLEIGKEVMSEKQTASVH